MEMSFTEWTSALGQVFLVVTLSFLVLCAIKSFVRFQLMSERALEDEELGSSEARSFRLAIVNQIPIARRSRNPISVVLLQLPENSVPAGDVEAFIKPLIRHNDTILVCDSRLVGLMLRCGSDNADVPVRRIMQKVKAAGIAGADHWRFGVSGYPEHGFKTSVLYDRAVQMIKDAQSKGTLIAGMAAKEDVTDAEVKKPSGGFDTLTGLVSEEKMLGVLRRFIAQERRLDLPVSLAYFEVDQPGDLTEQYGKPAYDQMIKELSSYLDKNIRANDIIARFGESGFVMALSAKPPSAVILARRVIEDVRRMAFKAGSGMKVSMCAGVAGYPDVMGTVVQYFVSAEAALQAARARGKNQCVMFDSKLPAHNENDQPLEQI